jgi:hypothetical protein
MHLQIHSKKLQKTSGAWKLKTFLSFQTKKHSGKKERGTPIGIPL